MHPGSFTSYDHAIKIRNTVSPNAQLLRTSMQVVYCKINLFFLRAVEFDDKTRSTADTIDRMRSDLRRYGDRVRILESNMQEHAVARNDLQQVQSFDDYLIADFCCLNLKLQL